MKKSTIGYLLLVFGMLICAYTARCPLNIIGVFIFSAGAIIYIGEPLYKRNK